MKERQELELLLLSDLIVFVIRIVSFDAGHEGGLYSVSQK